MSGRNVRVTPVRPANVGRLQSLIVKNSRYKTPAAKTQEITKMIRGVDSISDPEGKDRFLKEFQAQLNDEKAEAEDSDAEGGSRQPARVTRRKARK